MKKQYEQYFVKSDENLFFIVQEPLYNFHTVLLDMHTFIENIIKNCTGIYTTFKTVIR